MDWKQRYILYSRMITFEVVEPSPELKTEQTGTSRKSLFGVTEFRLGREPRPVSWERRRFAYVRLS